MKLLLDENLPRKLRFRSIAEHQVFSVQEMGWTSYQNGELLKLMQEHGFEALLTVDKGLQFQQNWQEYPLPVIILQAAKNDYDTLFPLVSALRQLLAQLDLAGGVHVVKQEE
ncbi:DUF5615 family PIN-like protein [Hymenobacter sp.]|jgi:hypothetical protein|uniref:DUF5615 family PIN-like protein n=1 Tax=Hymenobacter sp. TaxID=1898978 RepID=UPI002ED9DF27